MAKEAPCSVRIWDQLGLEERMTSRLTDLSYHQGPVMTSAWSITELRFVGNFNNFKAKCGKS